MKRILPTVDAGEHSQEVISFYYAGEHRVVRPTTLLMTTEGSPMLRGIELSKDHVPHAASMVKTYHLTRMSSIKSYQRPTCCPTCGKDQ